MASSEVLTQHQVENTILQVCLSGSEGYKALFLKDYMQAFQLFAKTIERWSLTLDKVGELHITFPWFPEGNNSRLLIWDRQQLQEGFTSLFRKIKRAPCWAEEGGCCDIDVMIVPIKTKNAPTTRNGRAIPDMSDDA